MAGAGDVLSALGSSALAGVALQSVTVETQFTPAYTYVPGPSGTAPAGGGVLSGLNPLAILKPKFTVQLATGGPPIVVAPYGEPSGNFLPYAIGAGAGLVALYALYTGAKTLAKGALVVGGVMLASGYLSNSSQTPAPVTS